MLTSATFQGGQDAAPDCGCKTPPSRLVLPPWFPTWPLTQRASWSGVRLEPSAAGYELAGHARPEQRGTALDRLSNVAVEIVGLSHRRTGRPRDGSRRPASTSWRTSFSECERPSRTEAASPRPSGPSLTGPHTRNSRIQELDAPDRRSADVAALHSKADANFALDNYSPYESGELNGFSLDGFGLRTEKPIWVEKPEVLKGETTETRNPHAQLRGQVRP